jgi:ketosteroid isomerase-like protein
VFVKSLVDSRGDGAAFFNHVADDVDWTVMGTHPLAGHYLGKQAFIAGTFAKLGQILPNGALRIAGSCTSGAR